MCRMTTIVLAFLSFGLPHGAAQAKDPTESKRAEFSTNRSVQLAQRCGLRIAAYSRSHCENTLHGRWGGRIPRNQLRYHGLRPGQGWCFVCRGARVHDPRLSRGRHDYRQSRGTRNRHDYRQSRRVRNRHDYRQSRNRRQPASSSSCPPPTRRCGVYTRSGPLVCSKLPSGGCPAGFVPQRHGHCCQRN